MGTEETEYGMYMDETDGFPRWNLPPRKGHGMERTKMIREAVKEYYSDYGGVWMLDRFNGTLKMGSLKYYVSLEGIKLNDNGYRRFLNSKSVAITKMYRMERLRKFSGMKPKTNLVIRTCPMNVYSMRKRLKKTYGYINGKMPVMLYDENTRRRGDEDELTRMYRIRFEHV